MNICGIVCEYNPFHNGHLHHINETKKCEVDSIVCIMSGNYVQRGDFAIMQKHARAETAVRNGADLVIELPLPWAISSAEHFAYGAISILDSLGIVSHISFGAESNNIDLLHKTAQLLSGDQLDSIILSEYSNGISYAKAREKALGTVDEKLTDTVRTPNNILAIEYLKALISLKSDISAIPISRFGAAHDAGDVFQNISSASFIRDSIINGKDISPLLPGSSYDIYMQEYKNGNAPVFMKAADKAILSHLKQFAPEDFLKYSDVSEGLQFRLVDAISKSTTLAEAIQRAKTKRYTHSRIRRIFLNAFLGVVKEFSSDKVPYARILAFNENGRAILKKAKKSSAIPIITRPSSIKFESKKAYDLLALERRADDIYSLFMHNPIRQGGTFTRSPIYISTEK